MTFDQIFFFSFLASARKSAGGSRRVRLTHPSLFPARPSPPFPPRLLLHNNSTLTIKLKTFKLTGITFKRPTRVQRAYILPGWAAQDYACHRVPISPRLPTIYHAMSRAKLGCSPSFHQPTHPPSNEEKDVSDVRTFSICN